MKRIIIPAGTVSGKKDYILEIPVDSYDQDENAIYILDDKSSRGSVKSLSDYFYDKDSSSQLSPEYGKQYLYQQNQDQQNAHMYTNHPSDNVRTSYPSNYMLKPEFTSANYQAENPSNQNTADISQSAKYYYYKSLGFTESELHKLLAKKGAQRRVTEVPSQRKQMRFNRMGVSEFSSLYEDPNPNLYQYEYFGKPINAATGNAHVTAYNDVMSNTTYSNIPNKASTNFDRNRGYYEDYPRAKQTDLPIIDARMYKHYDIPTRAPVAPKKNTAVRKKQSYTMQQNAASTAVSNKQMQNAYYQQRYYAKPVSTPKDPSPSTSVANDADQNQSTQNESNDSQDRTYESVTRTNSPNASISSNTEMRNYQKPSQYYPQQIVHPQKRTYRTIPGTSVVSNIPSIRIRNPVA